MADKEIKDSDRDYTDEDLSRSYNALHDLENLKTVFRGYDKTEVHDFLQHMLDEQADQKRATDRIIDGLRDQISGLKKDKDESVQKYNRLLAAKLGNPDVTTSSKISDLQANNSELESQIEDLG